MFLFKGHALGTCNAMVGYGSFDTTIWIKINSLYDNHVITLNITIW